MKSNPKSTRFLGLGLLLLAYALWLFTQSLCCGTLMFFIQLMTIGSLIIILAPLKKISRFAILGFFILAALLEFYYY